jgi:hypothetical protein
MIEIFIYVCYALALMMLVGVIEGCVTCYEKRKRIRVKLERVLRRLFGRRMHTHTGKDIRVK